MSDQHPLNLPYVGLVSFCRFPVCLEYEKLDADFAVLGIPFDEGAPNLQGQRWAPRRIREASLRFVKKAVKMKGAFQSQTGRNFLEEEFTRNRLVDCGDVDIVYTKPSETFANITRAVAAIRKAGAIPAIFGGDHSITPHVVQAFTESPLDFVVIDAHLDYVDEVRGIRYASMSPVRRVAELPNVRHIIQAGLRGFRNGEEDWAAAEARGNILLTADEFHQNGVEAILSRLPEELGSTYISIDIDGLDPSVAPACSGAEPGGLTYSQVQRFLREVVARGNVVGFDINEVNPPLDWPGDYTSLVAAQLALELMGEISESKQKLGSRAVGSTAAGAARK